MLPRPQRDQVFKKGKLGDPPMCIGATGGCASDWDGNARTSACSRDH
jgi:hypothetical protein